MAALSVGLYVANRERLVAERRFQQVRALANRVLEMDNRMRGVAGFLKPRMDLAALSQEYLEALTPAATGDPQLALEIGQAYLRLARIQGGPLPSNLGLVDEARQNLRMAGGLIDSVLAVAPENQEALLASAQIAEGLMELFASAGQADTALDYGQRPLSSWKASCACRSVFATGSHRPSISTTSW
jgi:tetratricopeptide (TPR) repeat protein